MRLKGERLLRVRRAMALWGCVGGDVAGWMTRQQARVSGGRQRPVRNLTTRGSVEAELLLRDVIVAARVADHAVGAATRTGLRERRLASAVRRALENFTPDEYWSTCGLIRGPSYAPDSG